MRIFSYFIRLLKLLTALSFLLSVIFIVFLLQLICLPTPKNEGSEKETVDNEINPVTTEKLHLRYWDLVKYHSGGNISIVNRGDNPIFNYSLWRPGIPEIGGHDRIVEQLVWFMEPNIRNKIQQSKKKNIVLLNYFSNWNIKDGENVKCPGGKHNCRFLENKNHLNFRSNLTKGEQINAVIFSNWQHDFVKNIPNETLKISYFLESPWSPSVRQHQDKNSLLASFWRGSDLVTPYAKWVYYDETIQSKTQTVNYASGKTRKVAIFVSNCLSYNDRIGFAKELGKYIEVHIYGQCGSYKCPRRDDVSCFEMLQKEYKFYLAFENANCRDYISEKFFQNALRNNVVPVVLGAPVNDYYAVAPQHSFIHIESFRSPQDLAIYLTYLDLTDSLYNDYFRWKGTGEFINTHFLCRVCAMLNYADMEQKPHQKETTGFPWTFRNKNLCLDSHRWYWGRRKNNTQENWDSSVFVSERLNTGSLANRASQRLFPMFKKKSP